MAKESHTFILVHGAWWGGDWWWRDVSEPLEAVGHKVYTPALTGIGSRAHLVDYGVNLTTHIEDVANFILWEGLKDIILVGHSYAGMVISGVAELVPEGTIRSIVYLDAFLPEDGEALADIASNSGTVMGTEDPVPPPMGFAGGDEKIKAVLEKAGTPHPRDCFVQHIKLSGALERVPIKTYVLATRTPQVFGRFAERVKSDPTWRLREVDTAHFMMIERPAETARLLLEAAD